MHGITLVDLNCRVYTTQCTFVPVHSNTVQFFCYGNDRKNYPGHFNHDVDLSVRIVRKSLKVGPLLIFSISLVIPEPGGVGSGASSSWLPKERFRLLAYDYLCKTLQKTSVLAE